MGQITIRIDDVLEKIIDEHRGNKPKSDYYREIIAEHANRSDHNLTTGPDIRLVEQLTGQVRFLEKKLDEANRLLLNEQTLHLTTQRMLPPSEKKSWYQFWK